MHPFAELEVPTGAVGIHWFEQNAYAFKDSAGTLLLTDPFFPLERPAEKFLRPEPPVEVATLPIDYVLLTHAHYDHTHPATCQRIHDAWPEARFIGPQESTGLLLKETGIAPHLTITIGAGESLLLGEGDAHLAVYAFYAKPPQGDPDAGIKPPDVAHLSYVVQLGSADAVTLYITGDAINTLAEHDALLEPIAALQPDIGFLTTHPTEGEFPFFAGSVKLAQKLGLKSAVPAHYECFSQRTYDPHAWAATFPLEGPEPLVIPWNSHVVYEGRR